jgi:hypothetical protein
MHNSNDDVSANVGMDSGFREARAQRLLYKSNAGLGDNGVLSPVEELEAV